MSLGIYDPNEISIVWGAIVIGEFADGTFVTAARNNQAFNLKMGAGGGATRAKSNDKSGTITFTLLQHADENLLLSAQAALDENTPKGDGISSFELKDNNGTTLCTAAFAWLQKQADVSYAQEGENREWVLETDNLQLAVGGNVNPVA